MPATGVTLPTGAFASLSGNQPAGLLDGDYSTLAVQINNLANQSNYFVDSGGPGALVVTVPTPLVVTYTAGLLLAVKIASTNAAGSFGATVNVNSLGAKAILYPDGSAILPSQFIAGAIVELQYDGTNFRYLGPVFGQGVFNVTWAGFSAPPSTSVEYAVIGGSGLLTASVSLLISYSLGTSSLPNMTWTAGSIPTQLRPSSARGVILPAIVDNSNNFYAQPAVVNTDGSMLFTKNGGPSGFTASGFKGIGVVSTEPYCGFTYPLVNGI